MADVVAPITAAVIVPNAAGEADAASNSPKHVAAFFDVDNTVIRGASSYHLARELYRRKFFGRRDIVRFGFLQAQYLLRGESQEQIDEVRQRALSLIAGRSVAEITAVGEEVYDTVLSLRIFPGTKALIDNHLRCGDQVWFVTATPVEIGNLIARRLGATGCIGTEAEHKNGFFTGRLIGDLMHGKTKATAVVALAATQNIELAASYAYSDSLNDLPMMELVGNPSPINPDRKLRVYARKVGWPVREFRERRKVARTGMQTASWAGAAWATGLAFRAVRRYLAGRRLLA